MCGWLKDKLGILWQIVSVILTEMITALDNKKSEEL